MRYSKLLISAICLISIFVLVRQAEAFTWGGLFSPKICVEGKCKGPKGEIECIFTLKEATVKGFCYNYVNSPNVTDCSDPKDADSVGWEAADIVVVAAGALGEKDQKYAEIEGCLYLDIFEKPCLESTVADPVPEPCTPTPGYIRTCNNSSANWAPLQNSFYISSMSVSYVCTSLSTGKIIEQGTQECTWPGDTNDTCSPDTGVYFNCFDEVIGKKLSCE